MIAHWFKMIQKWIVILLMLSLAACGFHLRGAIPLAPPLHHLYLKTPDPYGQLARSLRLFLNMSGVTLSSSPGEADTILVILSEQTHDQLIGITGNQATRQYQLVLSVTFQVTTPNGKILLSPRTIRESSMLNITAGQILAGSNEANNLYQQMRQTIVYDILSVLSSKNATQHILQKNSL